MTEQPTARLCYWLLTEYQLSPAVLSEIMELPEGEIRALLDTGHTLALWDLQRKQSVKMCGRKLRE